MKILLAEAVGVSDTTEGTTADISMTRDLLRNFSKNFLTTTAPKQLGLNLTGVQTRRIIGGRIAGDTRPYMVSVEIVFVLFFNF